jgi:hypothetical protein
MALIGLSWPLFVLVVEDRSVRGVGGRRGTGALVGPWWVRIRRVNRGHQWTAAVTDRTSKLQLADPLGT